MKQILLLAWGCLSSLACFAFESNGFKTEMSIERAKQIIAAKDMRVLGLAVEGRTNNKVGFEQLAFYKGAEKTNWLGVLAFCNDQLYFYSHRLDFDLDFSNALEKLLSQYGQPTTVQSQRLDYYDKPLFMSEIKFFWKKGDDEVTASILPEKKSPDGKVLLPRSTNLTYTTVSINKQCFKN
jgi:hypothetical protein